MLCLTEMPPLVSMPVAHVSNLTSGDHIKWKRLPGYDHHAIVEEVDYASGRVSYIEYGKDDNGSGLDRGVIKRETVHFAERMYKEKYKTEWDRRVLSPASVPVENPRFLKRGDRIKWKRPSGYDHYATVKDVDREIGEVRVIDDQGSRFAVHLVRSIYRYIYDRWYDVRQVLRRARSRLHERKYNPLTNNCEHFATWCKTGQESCSQIRPFVARVGTTVGETASGGLGAATVAKCAYAAAENGTAILNEAKNIVCGGVKNAVKRVGDAIVSGGKQIGFNGLRSLCNFGVTGAIALVTESCLFGYNCYKAQKNYKAAIQHAENKEMKQKLRQHRNNNIMEAGFEGVGATVGAAVGAAVGSFIPVVGTFIGAALGSIGGRLLGRFFGRWFRK